VTRITSMSHRALVCATAFSAVRAEPTLAEQAAQQYLGWPETHQLLDGSVQNLWRNILTPDETEGLLPLSPEQKGWLLFYAGALRGFNLALITAWRTTADTIEGTDALYPGFAGHCAIAHALAASERPSPLPGRRDDRHVAEEVTRGSLEMIRVGLDHGYGLGFVLDSALADRPGGSAMAAVAPIQAAIELGQRLRPRGAGDGAAVRALSRLTPVDRQRIAADALADEGVRRGISAHIAAISQARPMAVPATVGRFSWGYVTTMMAYSVRWWLTAGLELATRGADLAGEAPGATDVGPGLGDLAIEWARQDLAVVAPVLDKPDELRWRLATLAEATTAVAWRVAGWEGK
jgi:hypothetical protein